VVIYAQFELRCDGGPGPYDCEPAIYGNTVRQVRDEAARAGWFFAPTSDKHLCPEHKPTGEVQS
jgi:hypothetical protein